jgi:hypothetical protein
MAEHDRSNRIVSEAAPTRKDISVSIRVLIAFFIAFFAALMIAYSAYFTKEFNRKNEAQPGPVSSTVGSDN